MTEFNYMKFNDGRWIFNANKYTKEEATAIWLIEITENLKNNNNSIIIKPQEPYKFFAKFVNCDEILDYSVECECCEEQENYEGECGCYVLTAEAGFRELEKDEFEVWVFPSIQDLKNGTWEKEK